MATKAKVPDVTPGSLQEQRLNYLRECRPKAYRQMLKDGELEENLNLTAESAKDMMEVLVEQGMFEGEARNMAIREWILDSGT